MKDWVIDYLIERGEPFNNVLIYNAPMWGLIKEIDFNCLRGEKLFKIFLNISNKLIEALISNFDADESKLRKDETIIDKRKLQTAFTINFSSVLADFQEPKFHELCKIKNVLYFYYDEPDQATYVMCFKLKKHLSVDEGEEFEVVTFTHEVPVWHRLVCRQMIFHELIHVFQPDLDDDEVNATIREWGFNAEMDAANEYEIVNMVDKRGMNFKEIAKDLNKKGIKPPTPKPKWHRKTVKKKYKDMKKSLEGGRARLLGEIPK